MTIAPDSALATLWVPSPNNEARVGGRSPDMLILHYTGMESAEAALDWLTREESKVSCHYLVDEEGRIAQMVAEGARAWHAGQSLWAGETDLNSCSIGIEIHNPGHDFDYPDFPEMQMCAVEALCLDILGRHAIPPDRVLAHSDIAPGRKRESVSSRSCGISGFCRSIVHPLAVSVCARWFSSSGPSAMRITGVALPRSVFLISRLTAAPLVPGTSESTITRSGSSA